MKLIIIGNIIAIIASVMMVISGIVKQKKKILFYQTIEVGLAAISYLFLNSMSGLIINIINLIRNILGYKEKLNLISKIILSVLSIILVLYFNSDGIIGLLPLIAIIIYLWCITIKDVVKFKLIIIVLMILWTIYDFYVKNYVAFIFDILTILANIISIISIKKNR